MLRPLALALLILLAACASRQRPAEPVGAMPVGTVAPAPRVEPVEPVDPNIHPLSREMEEEGAR